MEALLKRDEWESAFALGEALTRSCVPVVWSRGLREFQKSCNRVSVQNAIDGAIRAAEIAKNEKRVQLRRGLNGLSAISITAPFVGLFGSCVGILDSFRGYAGNKYAYLVFVSTSLAQALVPIAVGLIVGVFAMWLLNYKSHRAAMFDADMNLASLELTSHLKARELSRRIQVPKNIRMPSNPQPAWVLLSPQIGVLYSQILLLLVPFALLVFPIWSEYVYHSQGLYALTYFADSWQFRHIDCQSWVVRVKSSHAWYLNSAKIESNDLSKALREQIGTRADCIVFFDADPDVDYSDAIHAIDLIGQTPGRVVLLTPQTKRVRIHYNKQSKQVWKPWPAL